MNEETIFTVDGKEIVRDLEIWVCPLFDADMSFSDLQKRQEKYIVLSTLNSCMVYTKDGKDDYPTFHRLEVFSTEEQAMKQRIINLDKIVDREKAILKSIVSDKNFKISEIQKFYDKLANTLGK